MGNLNRIKKLVDIRLRQLSVPGSLISLCLLILISPVVSRVLFTGPAQFSDSPAYSNEYILPSAPAQLNENSNQNTRSGLLGRRADNAAKSAARVTAGNIFRQKLSSLSSNLFFFSYYSPLSQRVYQLMDIPPPSCIFS